MDYVKPNRNALCLRKNKVIGQHMALHHAQVGAAQSQEQVALLENMVPHILQHAGGRGVNFQHIGELIHKQRQPLGLGQVRHLLPRLLPGGVGEIGWRRGLGIGEVVDGLGEGAQLVQTGGWLGHPVERPLLPLLHPLGNQAGFANAATAVEDEQGGVRRGPQSIEQVEFAQATFEGFEQRHIYTPVLVYLWRILL